MTKCNICKCDLDNMRDLTTLDCGGDCLLCMAECGDPSCLKTIFAMPLECMPADRAQRARAIPLEPTE